MNLLGKVNPKALKKKKLVVEKGLVNKLTEDLEKKGVEFFRTVENGGKLNIDTDYLALPEDLTDLPTNQLGKYLNAFTQQRMYIRTLLSWGEVEAEEHKRKFYDVIHPVYLALTKENPKMSETAKERIVNNSEEVKPLFLTYKDYKYKVRLIQYNLDNIENAVFLISREISRRSQDYSTENRNENIR